PISFAGDWFTTHEARMVGLRAQLPRVPFVIAANGPKGLDLVARFGQGWVSTGRDGTTGEDWWHSVATLAGRLDDAGERRGRDAASIDRYLSIDSGGQFALQSASSFDDIVGRAAALGFTDVIAHWPRAQGIYAGSDSVLDEVAGLLPGLR
ncbi:MAG: LLM class flavin-dependent oxidoreductase, partial [Candidatus Saccharibacteria bacterium]|nr:LLM class flavin-dependent oxidoreductase [Microbacteriaceae bacterium]